MVTLKLQGITEAGCCVYFSIRIIENHTMNQLVTEVKRLGYIKFRIVDTMKRFANVY